MKLFIPLLIFVAVGCSDTVEVSGKYLSVYPNPASTTATVYVFSLGHPFTLKVFDNRAKIIFSDTKAASTNLSAATYPIELHDKGTYYVILEIDNVKVKKTFVKI